MTALPDPNEFVTTMGTNTESGVQLHPDVRERYWGYEVRSTKLVNRAASFTRFGSLGGAIVFSVFGAAALMMPMPFLDGVLGPQWAVATAALCISAIMAHIYSMFRPVRVQIDTSVGEIREVVSSRLGGEVVLTRYGMDAVASVDVIASSQNVAIGQVHVRLNGYGVVPIGDGAVSALRPLRDRLAAECGLDTGCERPAIWSGPIGADSPSL